MKEGGVEVKRSGDQPTDRADDPVAATRLSSPQALSRLVAAATLLLAERGPSELKARTVAEAAGLSPTAVYYHVGGMPELLGAVVDHGFRQLADAFVAATGDSDPIADLMAIAIATRILAQRNPHLYDLMFGLSTRGSYRQLKESLTERSLAAGEAYQYLLDASRRLAASGRVHPDQDPAIMAAQLWSCVHGFVTLELGNQFADLDDPVTDVLLGMTVNVMVGFGVDSADARQSGLDGIAAANGR